MKYIKNYPDKAAYAADAQRPKNESTVSLVKDGTGNVYDGVNIVVDAAYSGVGDTIVYDKVDRKRKVVKLDTLQLATLPANYVVGGTVYYRETQLMHGMANIELGNFQWGAPYKVKLSGFDLTTGGNFTITVNTTTTASIAYTTSDTLATIATKIQDAITLLYDKGWTATAYSGYIVVQQNWYTPNVTTFEVTGGLTRVILTGNYQTALSGLLTPISFIRQKNGVDTSRAMTNLERAIIYYSVSGSEDIDQPVMSTTTVKESRFNITDNPLLVAHYKTYREYIADKMPRSPYSKGVITDMSGKISTEKLSAILYPDHDGTQQPGYPAAYAANQYGIDTPGHITGFEKGNWHMLTPFYADLLMRDITYGLPNVTLANMDDFNRGRYAAGLSPIPVTVYLWLISEYTSNNAWFYYGNNGGMSYGGKLNSNSVRPAQAFPL